MYDEPKRKLPLKALTVIATLKAVSAGSNFLFLNGTLDHEAAAIIKDQVRTLEATGDEEHRERGGALMRAVVEELVPLANRISKELCSIKDNPVAAYYLRHIHEAGKLLEGEKMVKRKLER